jgi:hypothetical protein
MACSFLLLIGHQRTYLRQILLTIGAEGMPQSFGCRGYA